MGAPAGDPSGSREPDGPAVVRHLYVHIPFCRSRCAYCDFYSQAVPGRSLDEVAGRYVAALGRELQQHASLMANGLDTVYLGGGTPTVLPADQLGVLLESLRPLLTPGAEVTVEANPDTLDASLLQALCEGGVNRVSLGVQSFHQELRRNLGRRVSNEKVDAAIGVLRGNGGRPRGAAPLNWNLDLVLGIPGQHRRLLEADLDAALAAQPSHISLYDLTYTPHYQAFVERRLGPAACGRAQRASEGAYRFAVNRLQDAGFRRYEVSNFAQPGCESRHNLGYWRGEDYLGLGAGATSTLGLQRRTNRPSLAEYLAAWGEGGAVGEGGRVGASGRGEAVEIEWLTPAVKRFERAMLGLRTDEGVDRDLLLSVADMEQLAFMVRRGLVREQRDRIALSAGGLDVSNFVLSAILRSPPSAS